MPNVQGVKFGDRILRRRIGNHDGRPYIKARDCLWEVREVSAGKYQYQVVGPLATKDKEKALGKTLPPEFVEKLKKMPEDGMGYQLVSILMKTGKLHRNVVAVNSSVVPNHIEVSQIVDVYKDEPGSVPEKIDTMVRSIQDVLNGVQCDPSRRDRAPCPDTCPVKQVCGSMNKIVMWSLLSKVYGK